MIILSVSYLFFFQPLTRSFANGNPYPVSTYDALENRAKDFSSYLSEKGFASSVFINKLNSVIEKHSSSCPGNMHSFSTDLKELADETNNANLFINEAILEKQTIERNLEKAIKSGKTKKIEGLQAALDDISSQIFTAEGIAFQIHPDALPLLTDLYTPFIDKGCPDGMTFIDGTYCVDTYEYPNKKGTPPAMGVSFNHAAQLCGAEGKKLCSGEEWARACAGPSCSPTLNALRPFHSEECNIIVKARTQVLPATPSGESPSCNTAEGVSDILGNAWEWTTKDYKSDFKTIQGGAGRYDRSAVCSTREWAEKSAASSYYGFRCCAEPDSLSEMQQRKLEAEQKPVSTWNITSSAFASGEPIPERHSCNSVNMSPPLSWTAPPEGTAELVLVVQAPDAPTGIWTHWTLYGLPPEAGSLEGNISLDSEGSVKIPFVQGLNSSGEKGYTGPCPPSGTHHYYFRLYALNEKLGLLDSVTPEELSSAMEGRVLKASELMGTFSK